jgi:restriction system protein
VARRDFQSVMLPFLETLHDGKERTMRELTEQLALRFRLTEEERQEHLLGHRARAEAALANYRQL